MPRTKEIVVGSPEQVRAGIQVVTDADGIPLNIPEEFMLEVIKQVLKESKEGKKFKKTDKIAVAAIRRVHEIQTLGVDTVKGISEDLLAQIMLTDIISKRRKLSNDFTKRETNPSTEHRKTIVFTPSIEGVTSEQISKASSMDEQVRLFLVGVRSSCLVPTPDQHKYSKPIRTLGKGGSGTVYHCTEQATGHHVAIKVMNLRKQPKLGLLLDELRLLRNLQHECIINFKESFVAKQTKHNCEEIYVIMEYVDGNSLYSFICNKDIYYLRESEIAYISKCSHSALAFLHSKGIIHRDIKSDNILVGKDGRCKVTDFGFCAKVEKDTLRKTQIGTPCWMPPEMVAKAKAGYDHRIDSWSFGIVLVECLDLDPPYITMPQLKAMVEISSLKGMPPCKNFENASLELKDFMKKHMIVNYTERPTSADLLNHPFLAIACTREHFGATISSHPTEFL